MVGLPRALCRSQHAAIGLDLLLPARFLHGTPPVNIVEVDADRLPVLVTVQEPGRELLTHLLPRHGRTRASCNRINVDR